jgi:hypothetical protein
MLCREGEGEGGTTVRLLWLSMLKVKQEGSGGCSRGSRRGQEAALL